MTGRTRSSGDQRPAWPARAFAWLLVRLRWLVLIGCVAGIGATLVLLPALQRGGVASALSIVPSGSAPVRTEQQVLREFHLPLLARTVIVERDPNGLSAAEQARVIGLAVRIDAHRLAHTIKVRGSGDIAGALPVVNTFGLFPSSSEHGTTALLYLFFPPSVPIPDRVEQAQALAHRYLGRHQDGAVAVTGLTAAQQEQGKLAAGALSWVELAAAAMIALVVGWKFRCIGAPIAALLTAGLAYEVSTRLIAWAGEMFGFTVPGELEPLIAVLVAGVSTDYSVFFLSAFRDQLQVNTDPHRAAEKAIAGVAPIVLTAGLSVVAGTAALHLANLALFRRLGPGMALSVIISALAALIFLPALITCAGRAVFWPGHRPAPVPDQNQGARTTWQRRAMRAITLHRPLAALALLGTVALLGAGAYGLTGISAGTNLVADLPADAPPAVGADQAAAGYASGIVAPTEFLIQGRLGRHRAELDRLQHILAQQPHVAGVVGPADSPLPSAHGVLITKSATAARYLVILDQQPYGAQAIATAHRLERRMPAMLNQAGISGVRVGVTGDTALSGAITTSANHDLIRVGLVVLAVLFVILAIFLRALLAPLLLLAATLLSVLAALGITSWLFQTQLDSPGLTFYVPFASAVLLLSFGSDYNIFLIGRIWKQARTRPFRERILDGSIAAGGPITTAGITLALSFALLAIIPLDSFREFALAMMVGVLLDTFVVRSVLVPAMLSLLGPTSGWPSRRLPETSETPQVPTG